MTLTRIAPQTGTAFLLRAGQRLTVVDPTGEQVSDFFAVMDDDRDEWLSCGRTIDYANSTAVTTGSVLYSNRSRPMATVVEDTCGHHDLLQRLHDADDESWADGVGSDPNDPHFAFSAGGSAYFIVGLHPAASRVARRAPLPTLVFNPHEQFEELRAEGRFDGMRTTIRRRDEDLQGFINPMVADHGDSTEALQYSGRRHAAGWEPPLDVKPAPDADDLDAKTDATTDDDINEHIDTRQGNRNDDLAGCPAQHD